MRILARTGIVDYLTKLLLFDVYFKIKTKKRNLAEGTEGLELRLIKSLTWAMPLGLSTVFNGSHWSLSLSANPVHVGLVSRESICLPWAGCSAAPLRIQTLCPISSPLPLLRPFCPLRLWVRMPGVGQAPCDGNQRSSRVTPVSWDTETSDQPLHHWILLWCLPLFPGLLLPLSRFPVPFLSLKYPGTRCIPAACQGPQETSEDGR